MESEVEELVGVEKANDCISSKTEARVRRKTAGAKTRKGRCEGQGGAQVTSGQGSNEGKRSFGPCVSFFTETRMDGWMDEEERSLLPP